MKPDMTICIGMTSLLSDGTPKPRDSIASLLLLLTNLNVKYCSVRNRTDSIIKSGVVQSVVIFIRIRSDILKIDVSTTSTAIRETIAIPGLGSLIFEIFSGI